MKQNFITFGKDAFPTINPNVYPDWARNYIVESQKSINCPMEYLTTVFLSLMAISIGKSTSLRFKNQWKEYPALYTVIIGSPSMKKTPAINAIFEPLDEIQERLIYENNMAIGEYDNKLAEMKKEKADPETKKSLQKPNEHLAYITDVTMEALMDALNNNPSGIMILKDELNHLLMSLNAYKSGGGDLETILELYGFKSAAIGRRGRERTLSVIKPFVCITGGIQFKPFKDFFNNLENGLIERFNFSVPDENINKDHSDYETSLATIEEYNAKVKEIYVLSREIVDSGCEVELTLSPEAKESFVTWWKSIPENSEHEGMFEKAKARALRIAIILHVLKHPQRDNCVIDDETMHNTLLISNYFCNSHIKAVYKLNHKENEDKVQHALSWFVRQYKAGRIQRFYHGSGISVRNFQTFNNSKYKTMADAYKLLEEMEAKGIGKIVRPPKEANKNIPFLFCVYEPVLEQHGTTSKIAD